MDESVLVLFKLSPIVLGIGVIILSKFLPYDPPNPSLYIVTDKESFWKYARKMIFTMGVCFIFEGILYMLGFYNIIFKVSVIFIPLIVVAIFNRKLRKYYKKIDP